MTNLRHLTNTRTKVAAIATCVTLAATGGVLALTPTAMAMPAGAGSDRADKEGSCTGTARYDLEADPERGGYEVSYEIDTDTSGQRWLFILWHDGKRVFRDVRVTDVEGEADFERQRPNTAGKDVFKVQAKHLASGRGCTKAIVRS